MRDGAGSVKRERENDFEIKQLLSNSITIRVFRQVLQHYPFPRGYGRFLPSYLPAGIHHNRHEMPHWDLGSERDPIIPSYANQTLYDPSRGRTVVGIPGIPRSMEISRSPNQEHSRYCSSSSQLYSSRNQWYCTKYCQTPLVLYVVRVS